MSTDPVPTPYVAIPTKEWDGNDGKWSTFRISVGEPGQDFRVLVSTQAAGAWVPVPEGCRHDDEDCPHSRGVELFDGQPSRGFSLNESDTWKLTAIATLDLEKPLDPSPDKGYFGFDKVRLGFSQNKAAVEVDQDQVVGYATPRFWMGMLGLNNAETNLGSQQPIPSLIKTLKDIGKIPSLSYSYTAGAQYRYKSVPGSLIIGGYDASRFNPPAYSFTIPDTISGTLAVGLQSIYTDFSLTGDLGTQSLASSHMSAIDSTVSQLWLPGDACNNFANAFGLIYDEDTGYYLINDTTHKKLLDNNPTLTFKLANEKESSDAANNIQIKLSYAAFDHSIGAPIYQNGTKRYFPIRRAENDTQNTIGRVFLQEAYLTVDYERKNFSLAQANFTATMPEQDVQTIYSTDYVPPAPSSSLGSGAKAGIAIGIIAVFLLLSSAIYFCWWRPRKQKKKAHNKRPSIASQAPTYQSSAEPPPRYYREGKEPYDPYVSAQQQQHRQHSVSEMPAGADNQARRPELDGVNVGGSSYELPAPVKDREEDVMVYEMGVGHEAASDADQDNAEVKTEQVERRGSEQRRPSEPTRPSQVETPPA